MYEEDSTVSPPSASPVSPSSPTTQQEPSSTATAGVATAKKSVEPKQIHHLNKNSSVNDILEAHQYYVTIPTKEGEEEENQQQKERTKASYSLNPQLIQHLGNAIQRQSIINRDSVKKGVMTFSKSTAYLSSQLSKGPLSDHDIKWLEVGLTPGSINNNKKSEQTKTTSDASKKPEVDNSSITSASGGAVQTLVPQQPSPVREGLFKVGESLIEVGKMLEGIEAASERYFIAKKRREMLVEQRDKLLRIAAAKKSPAAAVAAGSANTSFTRGKSPEQE